MEVGVAWHVRRGVGHFTTTGHLGRGKEGRKPKRGNGDKRVGEELGEERIGELTREKADCGGCCWVVSLLLSLIISDGGIFSHKGSRFFPWLGLFISGPFLES